MSSLPSGENSETPPVVLQELEQIHRQILGNEFVPALAALAQLVARDMRNPRLWLYIGLAYTRMGNWKPAISALETVLQINPQEAQAKHLLALALFSTGRQQEAGDLIDKVVKGSHFGPHWLMRAYIHSHTSSDPLRALEVARDWGKRFADPLTRQARPLKVADRSPRKKLKVGYVTADFREHSVAFFMQPVLAHHDHANFEVHVYSNGPVDRVTILMHSMVPHWHDIQHLSDEEVYEQIRAQGIDVLVDLSGFTHGHRLGVFARRAAPVQVTWLGYMQTLGMKAMDYRLVDAGNAPPSHAPYYSEALFHLHCMASYAPPVYAPLCEQPPMLRNGYPTLVSLNSSAKITDDMLRVWARILQLREDAQLIIMVKEENADAAQSHMQPRVEAAGMPLDRVSVLHQQPLNQFMEMGHIADIALDTSPISGGTTTLHALWMGVPLVTLDAERGVDASTARTLQGLGFGGEIAQSVDEYVQAALNLMADPERLQQHRLTAREKLRQSVLMDYRARTAELEKAYRLMWLNYLGGHRRHLNVDVDLDSLLADMDASV
ncbi:tetratricopeptide repeat protein [Delftia sp. PS-11]|uniref:O-linked N-acetylglucosamine transferase, SPINDLY family protein n=1 Tax=Delftia sp. PS-11 TaxID=2767222 RepID=UPI00245460CD|nr:tetratricopeptide repeat protein [Delftia sp. PS-11]KAJ8746229.1 glycosyltransferase [Delftia sp. PS-11]